MEQEWWNPFSFRMESNPFGCGSSRGWREWGKEGRRKGKKGEGDRERGGGEAGKKKASAIDSGRWSAISQPVEHGDIRKSHKSLVIAGTRRRPIRNNRTIGSGRNHSVPSSFVAADRAVDRSFYGRLWSGRLSIEDRRQYLANKFHIYANWMWIFKHVFPRAIPWGNDSGFFWDSRWLFEIESGFVGIRCESWALSKHSWMLLVSRMMFCFFAVPWGSIGFLEILENSFKLFEFVWNGCRILWDDWTCFRNSWHS